MVSANNFSVDSVHGTNVIIGDGGIQNIHQVVPTRLMVQRNYDPSDGQLVVPSNAQQLIKNIVRNHLSVVYTPTNWDSAYFIDFIASRVAIEQTLSPIHHVYEIFKSSNAESVIEEIKIFLNDVNSTNQPEKGLFNAVVIIYRVRCVQYSPDNLRYLQRVAKEYNLYLILNTDEHQWKGYEFDDTLTFSNVTDPSPYTVEDLTNWLIQSIQLQSEEVKVNLRNLGIINNINEMVSTTQVYGLGQAMTIRDIAESLQTTFAIRNFSIKLEQVKKLEDVRQIYENSRTIEENRIQTWFNDDLELPEQLLAISVTLFNGLSQDAFWAVYELLVRYVWRERNVSLQMADYHAFNNLMEYIRFGGQSNVYVEMDQNAQSRLLDGILDTHRRTVMQALPFLAYLLTYPEQTTVFGDQPRIDELRALHILGSQYDTTQDIYTRRQQLDDGMINSIIQVRQREPSMTEHLLLVWAIGNIEQQRQSGLNKRLRQIFSQTLISLYQAEIVNSKESEWYKQRTSYNLLASWYTRYVPESTVKTFEQFWRSSQNSDEKARIRIRMTLVQTLCELGRVIPPQSFDGNVPVGNLLTHMPDTYPDIDGLPSPWSMLVALAWDPSPDVREQIALHIFDSHFDFYAKHPQKIEALTAILSTDLSFHICNSLANNLRNAIKRNAQTIYLVFGLLDHKTNQVIRRFPNPHKQHYLWMNREDIPNELWQEWEDSEFRQLWTATLTIFLIGSDDPIIFQIYLQTYLNNRNSQHFKAFQKVLKIVLNKNNNLYELLRNNVLHQIAIDTIQGNRRSYAAEELLTSQQFYATLEDDEKVILKQLGPIPIPFVEFIKDWFKRKYQNKFLYRH